MKRLTLIFLTVATLLALATAQVSAQAPDTRIVFVDSQAAIAAHPAGEEARRLEEQARQELGEIRAGVQELAARVRAGEQLSAADQERYQALLASLDSVQQRYQAEIASVAQPAIEAVNRVIAEIAQENGYTIVLDSGVAGASGTNLVIYAQEGLDITQLVIERIQTLGQ